MRSLKLLILFTFCFAVAGKLQAQFVQQMGYKDYSLPHVMNIGAGVLKATDSSAVLELGSENSDKGVLLPRAHRSNIVHPKKGLAIYDLDWNKITWFNGTSWDTSGSAAAGAANYNFDLPIQVAGNGHITLPGWHAPKWDSAFSRAAFDTLTRYLRLTDISGASTYIYIPKGSSSGLDPRITDANISFWKTALSTNDTAAAFADFLRGKDTQNIKYRLDTMLNSVGKTSILDFSGGLIQNGTHVTALSDINYWNAGKLQGTPIASTLPTVNQFIGFNGSQYAPVTPHLYSTINQITDTSFTISRPDGSQDTVTFSLPLPNTGVKLDTSAAYINNIVLQGSGILHTSPATYNYSNHTATLTQTLANQNPYTLFGTGATAAQPTFIQGLTDNYIASISAGKITGTPGGVPYFDVTGHMATSSNFQWDYTNNRLNIGNPANTTFSLSVQNNTNGFDGIITTNTSTGTSAYSAMTVINNISENGSLQITGSNYSSPALRNRTIVGSTTGLAIVSDAASPRRALMDNIQFYPGGSPQVPVMTLWPTNHVTIGDSIDTYATSNPHIQLKVAGSAKVDTLFADVVSAGGTVIGSGGGGTGTTYTDFKEEFTSQTTTTKTLLHTPAFPAATLLFYNNGNGYSIQSSAWYSIAGSTLTLNFTPASTDKFIIKYSY